MHVIGQTVGAHLGLGINDVFDALQEPHIVMACGANVFKRHAEAHGLSQIAQSVRTRFAEHRFNHVFVHAAVRFYGAFDLNLVKTVQAGLHRAVAFLQGFFKGAAHCHRFADGFHRRRQQGFGTRKFFEREARNLDDHVVDGRLK